MSIFGGADDGEVARMKKTLRQQDMNISNLQSQNAAQLAELATLRTTVSSLSSQLATETQRAIAAEEAGARAKSEIERGKLQVANLEAALTAAKRVEADSQKGRRREEVERERTFGHVAKESEEERKALEAKVRTLEAAISLKDEELRRQNEPVASGSRRHARLDPAARALALENEVLALKAENSRLIATASASTVPLPPSPRQEHGGFFGSEGAAPRRRARRSSVSGPSAAAPSSSGEVAALRLEVDSLSGDLSKASERAAKAEREALKISNELIAAQRSASTAASEAKEVAADLRQELQWARQEADAMRRELDGGVKRPTPTGAPDPKLQKEVESLRLRIEEQDARVERLETELEAANQRAEAAEAAAAAAEAERASAASASASASPQLAQAEAAAPAAPQSETRALRELRRELNAAVQARDTLRSEVTELEDEVERLTAGGATAGPSERDLQKLQTRVVELEAEVAAAQTSLDLANAERDEAFQAAAAAAASSADVEAWQAERTSLVQERENAVLEVEQTKSELERLRQEAACGLSRSEEATAQLAELQTKLSDAEAARDAASAALAAAQAALAEELASVRAELETSIAGAGESQQRLAALEAELETRATALLEAEQRASAAEQRVAEQDAGLQTKLDEAQAEIRQLTSAVEALDLAKFGAEHEAQQAVEARDTAVADAQAAKERLAELEATIASQSADTTASEALERASMQLEATQGELQAAQTLVAEREADVEQWSSMASELEVQLQTSSDQVARLQQAATEAELELDVLRSNVASGSETQQKLEQLRLELAARNEQLGEVVPALRKREAELTSAKRRVQRLASTVRSAFAAGAGALGDESMLRGDMSMSFAACADESTFFATPGGRASSRSFETDLFDEIDQVKQHIEDASRRMDFQRVETEMQLRRARTEIQANAALAETASVPTQDSGNVSVESAGTEMPRQRSVTPQSEPLPDLATELAAKRAQLESLQARREAAALSQASAAATVEYVAKLEARVAAHQAEIRDYLQRRSTVRPSS
ncbi:hypothetical protein FA09DRAFT_161565 [Tilletiopsis washingtonensis]|uniref:Uncharacterized protein n=1 Tax=Tilletiopsis washingtonensis TaxID=58919 RepID=A0A316Z1A5_9BASI|nr:hypothetical protein FA09DRAFT_161565 [Tilletiopsis washingtonensis]PWN94864.1 hypothetical protein FA09DRAFT_161565 [Tilletiopsis washingtonensis]